MLGLAGWFSGKGLGAGLGPSGGCTASFGWGGWWGEEEAGDGGAVVEGWEAATAAWLRRHENMKKEETEQKTYILEKIQKNSADGKKGVRLIEKTLQVL